MEDNRDTEGPILFIDTKELYNNSDRIVERSWLIIKYKKKERCKPGEVYIKVFL